MNNGIILSVLFGLIILSIIVIQYFLWRSRMKDKASLEEDWRRFLESVDNDDVDKIRGAGDKLLWNKYLKQKQLTKITEVVKSKIDKHPELKELHLNAFNKQLDYNKTLPESGSSGGIKQSWIL